MNIGYACLTLGVPNTQLKTCISRNATNELLLDLIRNNLTSLENIIDYNVSQNIRLFRISSDLIPFGSSPVNTLPWWEIFAEELFRIGGKIKNAGMRVSMHPGQYTVLNSPEAEVVKRAVEDLEYHTRVLDGLGLGPEHKIILHIGGVYNEKEQAIRRFAGVYDSLCDSIKDRLVLENDERSYSIRDVLEIGRTLGAPVVFDNLHHWIYKDRENGKERTPESPDAFPAHVETAKDLPLTALTDADWIRACKSTWKDRDGRQKIHYSQQEPGKQAGSHSGTTRIAEFLEFYNSIREEDPDKDPDIMLEVKDKNLSAVKCLLTLSENRKIKLLEQEWGRYKYLVLAHSQSAYDAIRELLKEKERYPAEAFYTLIEGALAEEPTIGSSSNAFSHVFGYFKHCAKDSERKQFMKLMDQYQNGQATAKTMIRFLWKLTVNYNEPYLINSYFFML